MILTYNFTKYDRCDYFNASDDDFQVWSEAGVSTLSEVPLVQTGPTYFFCSTNNSIYCLEDGMKLAINVTQGEGLPLTLQTPPPSAPTPNPSSPSTPPGPPSNYEIENNFASCLNVPNELAYVVVVALISCLILLPLGL